MALRPVPKPRMSKTSKTFSADVDDLHFHNRNSSTAGSTTMSASLTTACENSMNNAAENIDEKMHSSINGNAVENPGYETYVPLRPKSTKLDGASNSNNGNSSMNNGDSKIVNDRGSNLIWFASGVPANFKAPEGVLQKTPAAELLDASPSSNILPQIFNGPPSRNLYPKLPPSPIAENLEIFEDFHEFHDGENKKTNLLDEIKKEIDGLDDNGSSKRDENNFLTNSIVSEMDDATFLQNPDLSNAKLMFTSDSSFASVAEASYDSTTPFVAENRRESGREILENADRLSLLSSVASGTSGNTNEISNSFVAAGPNSNGFEAVFQRTSVDGSLNSGSTESDGKSIELLSTVLRPERKALTPVGSNICYAGWLTKCSGKRKETVRRWCLLKNGIVDVRTNEMSENVLESVACKAIEMISLGAFSPTAHEVNSSASNENTFVITFLMDGRKLEHWILTADRQEETAAWMTLLIKSIIRGEAADLCDATDRAGPLFLKKGSTGEWVPGWFVMRGKSVFYASEGDQCCYEIDIRKLIRIRTINDPNDCCPFIKTPSPMAFVICTEGSALYVQSQQNAVTGCWKDAIESTLSQRTGTIEDERLTTDFVPILVDKCINFVDVHGLSAEGIYRHSGTSTKVQILFDDLMKDPHSVHLRPDEYSVHDVASVLKRFLRQLEEPLVTLHLKPRLMDKALIPEHGSRINAFRTVLDELPTVNKHTLKRILRHLHMIGQNSDKNRMTSHALAAIFGPTLFSVDKDGNTGFSNTSQEIAIVSDMITSFRNLFDIAEGEERKEQEIQAALKRIESNSVANTRSPLLLSIHVMEKDANVFNMAINNVLTATAICEFTVSHKRLQYEVSQLSLFEVICGGQLERALFPNEKLLDLISRWMEWPAEERATNYVIVKKDYWKDKLEALNSSLLTSVDVHYSEARTFRKCTFQCSKGEVLLYKNSKAKKPLQQWPVEKILWYWGHEPRRQPPTKYCLTFIDKNVKICRTKNAPFFGRCISFKDETDLLKWLTTVTLPNQPLQTAF